MATAFTRGYGFGTDVSQLLSVVGDYLYREIRASASRADITSLRAEVDAGSFIRSAGDATANGGAAVVGRVAVLRGPTGKVPPGPNVSGGDVPYGYTIPDLLGWKLLWQSTVFGWPRADADRFLVGELSATPDRSLYVVFGGLAIVLAGTIAVPGSIATAPATNVTLSVGGIDFGAEPQLDGSSGLRSMPRYDVEKP